ncbi:DUF4279 domain-containing protein [Streptomyces sp. NPDC012769]|uniref:DUF4279 domain-containing protein n=1 Tax=Streptomyces sp. NPDC012769 TaxID=3364848 RepID=UPI00368E3AC9
MSTDRQQPQHGARWTLTSVALVVRGPALDPDALTARVALRPTATRPPGPSRWGPPDDIDGEWRLQCDERTTRDFAAQLDTVLTAAEPYAEQWRALRAEGVSVALVVRGYVDNDSQLALTAEEVRRVARLGLPLTLTPSTSER